LKIFRFQSGHLAALGIGNYRVNLNKSGTNAEDGTAGRLRLLGEKQTRGKGNA